MPSTRGPSAVMAAILPSRGVAQDVRVREIPISELTAVVDDPFLHHHVDPTRAGARAWVHGRAAVVDGASGRHGWRGPAFSCVGPAADLGPLMAALADRGEAPVRVSVDHTSASDLPNAWQPVERLDWHWMWTATVPEQPTRDGVAVTELAEDDPAERAAVEAVLDAGYADSFARPGVPGAEAWLGVTHRGDLAGVGVLIRQPSGAGLIRAVTVLPDHRGHGLARVLSAALTRRAVAGGSGTATLGVYTTNAPAVRVYERLGFRTAHTFVAGPTCLGADTGTGTSTGTGTGTAAGQASVSPSTSASTPSR